MSIGITNGGRIRTNIAAEEAYNVNKNISSDIANRQLRLATGKRVNSASDDVSGFITSRSMQTRVGSLRVAANAIGDAKGVIIMAQDALDNISGLLAQIKDAAATAASGALATTEKISLAKAAYRLTEQIQTVVDSTVLAGRTVLGGGFSGDFIIGFDTNNTPITFGIDLTTTTGGRTTTRRRAVLVDPNNGRNNDDDGPGRAEVIFVRETIAGNGYMVDVNSTASNSFAGVQDLNLLSLNYVDDANLGIFGREQIALTIQSLSSALDNISSLGSYLGGLVNRLQSQESNIATQVLNYDSAISRVEDSDYAQEQLQLIRAEFMERTSVAVMSQANQNPLAFLRLLG